MAPGVADPPTETSSVSVVGVVTVVECTVTPVPDTTAFVPVRKPSPVTTTVRRAAPWGSALGDTPAPTRPNDHVLNLDVRATIVTSPLPSTLRPATHGSGTAAVGSVQSATSAPSWNSSTSAAGVEPTSDWSRAKVAMKGYVVPASNGRSMRTADPNSRNPLGSGPAGTGCTSSVPETPNGSCSAVCTGTAGDGPTPPGSVVTNVGR